MEQIHQHWFWTECLFVYNMSLSQHIESLIIFSDVNSVNTWLPHAHIKLLRAHIKPPRGHVMTIACSCKATMCTHDDHPVCMWWQPCAHIITTKCAWKQPLAYAITTTCSCKATMCTHNYHVCTWWLPCAYLIITMSWCAHVKLPCAEAMATTCACDDYHRLMKNYHVPTRWLPCADVMTTSCAWNYYYMCI